MTRSGLSLAIIALSGVLMQACSSPETSPAQASRSNSNPLRQPATESVPTVVVTPVIKKTLERVTQLPAEMIPYRTVELFPKASGFVEWIGVDRGSKVRKGQVLIRLTAPEIKSQRAEAKARLHSIQSQRVEAAAQLKSDEGTYNRLKAAATTPGVVSGNELEIAERSVEARRARLSSIENSESAAQAALKSVQELESYLTVIAPFDGVITERNVHEGALVGPSGTAAMRPMLRLEQVAELRLVVPVPERDVSGVSRGTKVSFRVPAFPGETFQAVIRRIAHSVEPKTRTMPVELEVRNHSERLSPGMFAEVSWPVKRASHTLFVPPSAVVTTTERTFVIRVQDGVIAWVDVRRGVAMPDLVEVFGDLQAGDPVVFRGSDELRPGTRVQTSNK